jgi:UDP-2,3-diacylglucosamine hydrolase
VAALGQVDVGQGAVVQQGLCLGVEALPGTDAMLAGVAAIPVALRPAGARGLYSTRRQSLGRTGGSTCPRSGWRRCGGWRRRGWAASPFRPGGVICLDLAGMVAEAQARGLFLWAREA